MRRGFLDARLAVTLAGIAVLAALLLPFTVRRSGPAVPAADTAALFAQTLDRTPLQDSLEASRRTAIVRAAEQVAPATVSVNVVRREAVRPRTWFEQFMIPPGMSQEVQGLGSGFIIDPSGLVLTNDHVVHGATRIVVTLSDGRDVPAELVGTDDVTDLALLRLENGPAGLKVAKLGTSSDLMTGEWVVAIGNPFGFLLSNPEPTVTVGVVSGVGRNIIPSDDDGDSGYYLDMIQTDAAINPGNSGGPLVNLLGEVIGVNSSIISESGGSVGLGFAIPIDRARRIADALLRDGQVHRAWTGVEVRQDSAAPGQPRRVRVASVVSGSPAARAGLRAGMVIQSANGKPVRSTFDWEARLLDTRVGEDVDVGVVQGGSTRTISVPTQDLPSLTAERVRALSDLFELVTLTPAIQAERGLVNSEGALIVSLSDDASNVGLREGDLVLAINRQRIRTAQDAADLLNRLRGSGARLTIERRGQLVSIAFSIGGG
ncbi:MAG: trypsin-like peptidase domain-containing protein [Gemmatimonadota bacterium]